jgi:hypothetical protein
VKKWLETVDAVSILFRQEVPEEFLRYIAQRQELIYGEARAIARENPRFRDPEVFAIVGHVTRACFESLLREAAEASQVDWADAMHAGNNLGYVKVRAGRFRITAHQVATPGEFVRDAVSRRQDAAVNDYVGQLELQYDGRVPFPRLASAAEIQAYVLYGQIDRVDSKAGADPQPFLRLAIPDAGLTKYHVNCSFDYLMQGYLDDSRSGKRPRAPEDRRIPRTKKSQEPRTRKEGAKPE